MLEQLDPQTLTVPEPGTNFSLRPLIRVWEAIAAGKRFGNPDWARQVLEELRSAAELSAETVRAADLKRYPQLVDSLMSILFAPAMQETQLLAVVPPFRPDHIMHMSPAFRERFYSPQVAAAVRQTFEEPRRQYMRNLSRYLLILERLYGMQFNADRTIAFPLTDANGRMRYYQFRPHTEFIDVKAEQQLPPLSKDEQLRIRRHIRDLDVLRQMLPMSAISMSGFAVLEVTDISIQESSAALRHLLMTQDALLKRSSVNRIQDQLRSQFNLPDLIMRVAGVQNGKVYTFNTGCDDIHKLLDTPVCAVFRNKLQALVESPPAAPISIEDISQVPDQDGMLYELLQAGYHSAVTAPLILDASCIGVLLLASTRPGDFDPLTSLRLDDITQLFAVTVQRTFDSLNMQVQAVIKEQFTSIHPAVEWKFRDAALRQIQSDGAVDAPDEPIVFNDVYPLYGVSDIRSSSILRNQALKADLLDQLRMVDGMLRHAYQLSPLPYVGNLSWLVEERIRRIEPGLSSGDEIGIVEFLRRDIEPLFTALAEMGPSVSDRIQAYREAVDPKVGMVYRQRRGFDESVYQINEMVAAYLEAEQKKAQAVLPHFFELRKTDGVDHNIYVGASILQSQRFDALHLRNLRLWQLLVMCETARRTEALRGQLKVPLETAHLILVQHMPLSIRFEVDEKQFKVAGAYDIRYEIMKKRIDKAVILGTTERLTQPRMIAVAYSHQREGKEYRTYLEYLQSQGYLDDSIEELELDELPGVQGLRALRVRVKIP